MSFTRGEDQFPNDEHPRYKSGLRFGGTAARRFSNEGGNMAHSVKRLALGMAAAALLAGTAFAQSAFAQGSGASTALPAPSASDKANLPSGANHLQWNTEERLIGHRNMQTIFPTRPVAAGGKVHALPRDKDIDVSYQIDGVTYSLDDYFKRARTSGLLVIKNGRVVLERYGNGYTETSVGTSRSMSKSVTSIMVGLALKDGYIKSVDDTVSQYLPEFKGTLYENITLRVMLQMLSGIPYTENAADTRTDVHTLLGCVHKNQKGCLLAALREIGSRPAATARPPGTTYTYSTGDTALMAILVERASKMNLSEYLSLRVWKPFGMERDGYWNVESVDGHTLGGSGFGATLRDYARLGLFVMGNGVLPDGTKVFPDGWMDESIKPSAVSVENKRRSPTAAEGKEGLPYGYFWWRPTRSHPPMPGIAGAYSAQGSNGQALFVNPAENVVIAKWGPMSSGDDTFVFAAIVNKLH